MASFSAQVLEPIGGTAAVLFTVSTGPNAGQLVAGIYAPSSGDADTTQITLALGEPGGETPTSYSEAMTTAGMSAYYLAKCKATDPAGCDFNSVFPGR